MDYLGEQAPLGSAYGYLDNCMFRKSYFYYQQSQWTDAPMVHVTVGNGSAVGAPCLLWLRIGTSRVRST